VVGEDRAARRRAILFAISSIILVLAGAGTWFGGMSWSRRNRIPSALGGGPELIGVEWALAGAVILAIGLGLLVAAGVSFLLSRPR
jgi:hypothetical protein